MGERLIDGGESVVGIHHEQDQIGRFHGDVRLDGDLGVETVVDIAADAAGIDERAGMGGGLGGCGDAVAGDARLVVDDGDFAPGEAVEERGLADIGASDDGNGGHGAE